MEWKQAAFWTHGVNTLAEFPERCISVRRTGYGTIVTQGEDIGPEHNNWFHVPLHTIIAIDGNYSTISKVKFHVRVNEFVALKEIHVRYGHELIYEENVNLRGPEIIRTLSMDQKTGGYPRLDGIGPEKLQSGIALCLRFEFDHDVMPGEVIFYGAGLQYDRS